MMLSWLRLFAFSKNEDPEANATEVAKLVRDEEERPAHTTEPKTVSKILANPQDYFSGLTVRPDSRTSFFTAKESEIGNPRNKGICDDRQAQTSGVDNDGIVVHASPDSDNDSDRYSVATDDLLYLSSSDSESTSSGAQTKRKAAKHKSSKSASVSTPKAERLNAVEPNPDVHKVTYDKEAFKSYRAAEKDFILPTTTQGKNASKSFADLGSRRRSEDEDEKERFQIKITDDGLVRKMVDTAGTGPLPSTTAIVTYVYKAANNVHFKLPILFQMDHKKPLKSKLGDSEVIPGLEKGLLSMKRDERAILRVEPRYGFGSLGNSKLGFGPSTILYIYVELLDILEEETAQRFLYTDPSNRPFAFSTNEAEMAANQLHKMGCVAFAEERFEEGLNARKMLNLDIKLSQRNSVFARLHNNAALCCLKTKKWMEAVDHAQRALDLKADHPTCTKAFYIIGSAHLELGDCHKALASAKKGLAFHNANPELQRLKVTCEHALTNGHKGHENGVKEDLLDKNCASSLSNFPKKLHPVAGSSFRPFGSVRKYGNGTEVGCGSFQNELHSPIKASDASEGLHVSNRNTRERFLKRRIGNGKLT